MWIRRGIRIVVMGVAVVPGITAIAADIASAPAKDRRGRWQRGIVNRPSQIGCRGELSKPIVVAVPIAAIDSLRIRKPQFKKKA